MQPQPQPQPAASGASRRWAAILLVVLASVAAYAPALNGPFVWDDRVFVTENPSVREGTRVWHYFTQPETLSSEPEYNSRIYRPLRTLLFAGLYRVAGGDAFPYHLLVVALHAAASALAFLLLRRLGLRWGEALVAGLIFAAHPVHSEAVAWVSSLADPLFAALTLAAWLLFPRPGATCSARRWIAALSVYLVALFAKEMAATLPLLLCVEWALRAPRPATLLSSPPDLGQRLSDLRRQGGTFVTRLAPLVVLTIAYVAWRTFVLGRVGQEATTASSLISAALLSPYTLLRYLGASLLPWGQSAFYAPFEHGLASALAGAGVLGALAARVVLWRRNRGRMGVLDLLVTLFAVGLLPVLNLLPLWVSFAERFAYLSSLFAQAAVVVLAGAALRRLWPAQAQSRRRQRLAAALAGALVVALGAATLRRGAVWSDELALWQNTAAASPNNATVNWNLGLTLLDRNRPHEAALALTRAWGVPKPEWELHLQLAQAWLRAGDAARALSHARGCLRAADAPAL